MTHLEVNQIRIPSSKTSVPKLQWWCLTYRDQHGTHLHYLNPVFAVLVRMHWFCLWKKACFFFQCCWHLKYFIGNRQLKSEEKKRDMFKNWQLIKNPHFLSNPHETLSKCLLHEVIIFTKFHEDRRKIQDFLLNGLFFFLGLYI